jgi:lipopolysaccharide export system protein LptC
MVEHTDQRLSGLNDTARKTSFSLGYSRFVKVMRWALPIFALILMVVVIAWPELDDQIEAIPQEDILSSTEIAIGGNELLNPRYETTDSQNNPVFVKAQKAVQSQNNADLIRLDIPEADFKTTEGARVQVKAIQGTYDQAGEKLFLQDDVQITHESDYILNAEELRLNMKTQEAFSNKEIVITGQDAKIQASGIKGNMRTGTLTFEGPATLTLYNTNDTKLINNQKPQTNEGNNVEPNS